jgi:DNA (cytosine-5)-methyltransferase 1
MSDKIKFIDLFAGIGGIRIALEKQGFDCVFSSEWNEECAKTYEANFGERPTGDITKIDEKTIPEHDILAGGFPCQAFSAAGKQKGFDDTRGTLFFDILRIAKEKKPKILFLENVKNLIYHDGGKTLKTIINHLEELGYKVKYQVLNAKDFGVAQSRERIIIIASKDKFFDFSKVVPKSKEVNIKDILEEENPTMKFLSPEEYTLLDKKFWKKQKTGMIFVGYRNKPIRVKGARPNTEHLSRVHKQCNRIYSSDGTHPTISSTEIAGRFHIFHNGKVRKLTINECFRLMGFPDSYNKISSNGEKYKQIGNSVAIPMMEAVAEEIKKQLFLNNVNEKRENN